MTKTCCVNCKHFKQYSLDDDRGDCRRHAPVYSVHGTPRWPIVVETDWCGDFEKNENIEFNSRTNQSN